MQPEPDVMLSLIATKLIEQIVPQVDDYLKGDLHLLALIIRAAAERLEVEADVLLREHRAMAAIFDLARPNPDFAEVLKVAVPEPATFRLSDLRARNRLELELLARLDVLVGETGDGHSAIKAAIASFLQERTVLHAFNIGPFPTAGMAELQARTMRAGET